MKLISLLASFTLATSLFAADIPNLVAAWNFDEGKDKAAADSSATKANATLAGGATWVEGKAGKAVQLDGADGSVVNTGDLVKWLSKTASLSLWIKTKDTGNETFWQAPGIAGAEEAGAGNDIFWGWIDESGKIGLQAGDAESAKSSAPINDDKWHHVVLTRNHDNGEVQIYVDGKLSGSATSESGEKTTGFTALGKIENAAHFKGALDDVRIYTRVLTKDEVEQLFKAEAK